MSESAFYWNAPISASGDLEMENTCQVPLHALLEEIEQQTAPFLAESFEEIREKARQDNRKKKLHITFLLNEIELALPVDSIQEVEAMPPVTPLPNLPPWILGVTQVRGEVITMIELRTLFRISYRATGSNGYYILLYEDDLKFGFPVDRISGIIGFEEGSDIFKPAPCSEKGSTETDLSSYVSGTVIGEKGVLTVLDGGKLLRSSIIQHASNR